MHTLLSLSLQSDVTLPARSALGQQHLFAALVIHFHLELLSALFAGLSACRLYCLICGHFNLPGSLLFLPDHHHHHRRRGAHYPSKRFGYLRVCVLVGTLL